MNNLNDLGGLTLAKILENSLGRAEAENLLAKIQAAIAEAKEGDDLGKLIHKKLCESSVTDIEIYHLLLYAVKKPVIPGG